jgi:hypothetical protein
MKRPIEECPRYDKSELRRDGKEVVNCSVCYFAKVYGRDCKFSNLPRLSQIEVKAISNKGAK